MEGVSISRKIPYEEVKQSFKERGCKLLSTEYVGAKEMLNFICVCGRGAYISLSKLRAGQLCRGCAHERSGEKRRYQINEVRKMFEDGGCELLSAEYRNNKQKLGYICSCGNKSEIALAKFNSGQRCSACKKKKISEAHRGSKSHLWDHSKTAEDRIRDRKYPEYYKWRSDVFERDDYTCQCCGERGGTINAHHIESYAREKELRVDLDNGVTLCESCHKEYHRNFYRNDADEESFREFMYGEYREPSYAGEAIE